MIQVFYRHSAKLVVLLSVACLILFQSPVKAQSLSIIAKDEKGKIVQVVTKSANSISLGSGFWIDVDGYVATCNHVVSGAGPLSILVRSAIDSIVDPSSRNQVFANWEVFNATVVAADAANDVAILKVTPNPLTMPSHPPMISVNGRNLVAHYDRADLDVGVPQPGESVLIAGYPLGQPYLVFQQGTVASNAIINGAAKILLSAIANHGNSGGPVFNDRGNVVGLLEGELPGQQNERTGIELVVPVYFADSLMKSIQEASRKAAPLTLNQSPLPESPQLPPESTQETTESPSPKTR